jgi:hypothetical protein
MMTTPSNKRWATGTTLGIAKCLLTRVEIDLSWRSGGFADAAPWRLLEVYVALREWD